MILIATDEAGYGPTLGPMIVTATVWACDASSDPSNPDSFAPLRRPIAVDGGSIVVDDSKKIHQSRSKRTRKNNTDPDAAKNPDPRKNQAVFEPLSHIAAAAALWCGRPVQTHHDLMAWLLPDSDRHLPRWMVDDGFDVPLPTGGQTIVDHWRGDHRRGDHRQKIRDRFETSAAKNHSSSRSTPQLIDVNSRSLIARSINDAFDRGLNKSDLLGETTLGLVVQAVQKIESSAATATGVDVFCDRLGGRRYYAGLIQHHFPDAQITILDETRSVSRYALTLASGRRLEIRYSVKGDSHPPVAMSSCISKYLREAAMRRLNGFFQKHIAGLKPTAGYPVDAARFLDEIADFRRREKLADRELIRSR